MAIYLFKNITRVISAIFAKNRFEPLKKWALGKVLKLYFNWSQKQNSGKNCFYEWTYFSTELEVELVDALHILKKLCFWYNGTTTSLWSNKKYNIFSSLIEV